MFPPENVVAVSETVGGAPLQLISLSIIIVTPNNANHVISNFPTFKDADWPSLSRKIT